MKRLLASAAIVVIAAACAAGTRSRKDEEQEVRGFLAEFDTAVSGRDIAFLERVLPNDYVFTGGSGRMSDRTGALKFFQQERDKPSYRMKSLKHENVQVRVVGDMAVVTNDYTSQTTPVEAPDADPETFRGRHTGVFEKRNGRWMVIAEQDTERPQDADVREQHVMRAARDYHALLKRLNSGRSYAELEAGGDIAALKRQLADEHVSTSRDGEISTRAERVESYKTNQLRLESADIREQTVRAIGNGTVLETGTIRYVGTNAGKPFDTTQRYTTTWVSWDGWQIIAEHMSTVTHKD